MPYDLAIIGAGPGGAACAIAAARLGMRALVIERARFPRHKVCGDCLNPGCWPVFDSLGVTAAIRALPHAAIRRVRFESPDGRGCEAPVGGQVAIRRDLLDAALADAAQTAGATLAFGETLLGVRRSGRRAGSRSPTGRSTARAIWSPPTGATPPPPGSSRHGQFRPAARPHRRAGPFALDPALPDPSPCACCQRGYGGIAPVGADLMNVCLVGDRRAPPPICDYAEAHFGTRHPSGWAHIAPLRRKPSTPAHPGGALLVGDAARVVEPFTGEGIYYALRSGRLAAEAALAVAKGTSSRNAAAAFYRAAHRRLYRGRLWVNALARIAVTQ
ncbi:MAG: FAD-dependent monooxygenase [Verrucomicrobiales bacterium]